MDEIADLRERIVVVERQLAVDQVHRTNIENRLGGIEGNLRWLVRLLFGAILLAVLGFAMNGGFVIP